MHPNSPKYKKVFSEQVHSDLYISSVSGFGAPSNTVSYSVISSRSADRTFTSFGATTAGGAGSSYSVKRTASFIDISGEIIEGYSIVPAISLYDTGEESSSGRPGIPGGGTGEYPPPTGQLMPVGDMILPMLVIALGYVVVRFFRNRKTSQAL